MNRRKFIGVLGGAGLIAGIGSVLTHKDNKVSKPEPEQELTITAEGSGILGYIKPVSTGAISLKHNKSPDALLHSYFAYWIAGVDDTDKIAEWHPESGGFIWTLRYENNTIRWTMKSCLTDGAFTEEILPWTDYLTLSKFRAQHELTNGANWINKYSGEPWKRFVPKQLLGNQTTFELKEIIPMSTWTYEGVLHVPG